MVRKGSRKFISKIMAVNNILLKVKGTYEILNVRNFFPTFSLFFPLSLAIYFSSLLKRKRKSYTLLGAD